MPSRADDMRRYRERHPEYVEADRRRGRAYNKVYLAALRMLREAHPEEFRVLLDRAKSDAPAPQSTAARGGREGGAL